jgi:ubiquinone/menaquinone biosynthesis C-methylase UbiE
MIYRDRQKTALGWIWELDLGPNARVLEVGCGAGLITVALARNGYSVDALDPASSMLQMTRDHAADQGVEDRIRIHTADVHALPFQPQTFDLVVAIGVIPWLHSEQVALQEMQRVLKPGGCLLVTADNNARLNGIVDPLSSPLSLPVRWVAKRLLQLLGLWPTNSRFRPKRHYPSEVDRLMGECNFKKLKSCTVGFGPFSLFGKTLLTDSIGIGLHRRLERLASRPYFSLLRWTGSHYLVLATKDEK